MSPGDGFSSDSQPNIIEGDRDDVLKVLMGDGVGHQDTDAIEPALDE